MEALTLHATSLRSVGVAVADIGARVHSTWQGLGAVYRAPEAEQLLTATLPVQQATASTGEDIEDVASILIRYAEEVRDIQARLRTLSGQAAEFQADMAFAEGPGADQAYVDRNNELVAAVNAAVADFDDAQRRCANAINALYRSATAYRSTDDDGRLDSGEFGATAAQLDTAAATPAGVAWGAVERPAPPAEPRTFTDYAQDVLFALGLVPVVGEPADGLSAALYAADGDYAAASLSAASALPIIGWGAAGARVSARGLADEVIAPASSAVSGRDLARSLASESQIRGPGEVILGAGTSKALRDAQRLADTYGGNAADWAKMTSPSYRGPDGHSFETHWYENVVTGQRVEPKTKRFN